MFFFFQNIPGSAKPQTISAFYESWELRSISLKNVNNPIL